MTFERVGGVRAIVCVALSHGWLRAAFGACGRTRSQSVLGHVGKV
ncbi:hypothetical protein emb_1d0858 [Coriobacteriaceae bacterium EMTCatB1]|nr:hypothetical protein emb_1d0858 [Coriobacteriaceae bacterium EMTCatB1]